MKLDVELTADDLKELAGQFKAEYKEKIGTDFPTNPKEQLTEAIKQYSVPGIILVQMCIVATMIFRIPGERSQCSDDGIWKYGR